MRPFLLCVLAACWSGDAKPVAAPTQPTPAPVATSNRAPAPVDAAAAERGAELARQKGCVRCHTVDGSARVGPTWLRAWGSTITTEDGRRVDVDEAYVRRSILQPQADLVKGFPPVMPTFDGVLKPDEQDDLVAYIRSLR